MNNDIEEYFTIGYFFGIPAGIVAFVALWAYAVSEWGLLIGLAFGWLPAFVGGFLVGTAATLLWPLICLAVAVLIFMYWR